MTNEQRIEELEIALERLLECFDTSNSSQRPWIEVEVEFGGDSYSGTEYTDIRVVEGQVTEPTAEAIELAELTLYDDDMELGGPEEDL